MSRKDELIYGSHAVNAILKYGLDRVRLLYQQEGQHHALKASLVQCLKKQGVAVKTLSKEKLANLTKSNSHQGLAVLAAPRPLYGERDIADLLTESSQPPLVLVLDSVQDPHNLGACLRSADAASASFVMMAKAQSASLNAVVHKVSCGASQSLPIVQVSNLVRGLKTLQEQGLWLVGTSAEAKQSIYQTDMTIPTALIMGSEGSGMRASIEKQCDYLAAIPMTGFVESLNISVASALCLFECRRQRTGSGDTI